MPTDKPFDTGKSVAARLAQPILRVALTGVVAIGGGILVMATTVSDTPQAAPVSPHDAASACSAGAFEATSAIDDDSRPNELSTAF